VSPYAQTIVQLQAQAQRCGLDASARGYIAGVHAMALELFSGRHRGSGRPFLSHLVATSSILLAHGQPLHVVAAGLVHATYEQGDFGHAASADDRRAIASIAGERAEAAAYAYAARGWTAAAATTASTAPISTDLERDVLMMRLANELDDHLDAGILYCADAERRLARLARLEAPLLALARHLGVPELADELADAFAQCRSTMVPVALRGRTGSSYLQVPRSCTLRWRSRWHARGHRH